MKITQIKPLRFLLLFCVLLSILLRPAPETEVVYSGFDMLQTLLLPVLVPIFFMLLLLDSLMSSIWITQTEGAEKQRYQGNVIINLSVVLLLVYFWWPYFSALGK